MKPLIIFLMLIAYLSQPSPAFAYLSSLNIAPQKSPLISGKLVPRNLLKMEFTAEETAHPAYLDTFHYQADQWIPFIKERIDFLESLPKNVETQLELLHYYFILGGLNVELSHIMGVNSKYKIPKLEKSSILNIRQAKQIAKNILVQKGLTASQQAQVYFYLGASEGSLGGLEFRAGNIFRALVNGFQADTHLEKALRLDSNIMDAHLGLGIYRYGNSRLGGLGNLIMQWGRDRRQEGLSHIERAIRANGISTPLAIKTLGWFYIAVQINPVNADLPGDHPLSPAVGRARVHELIDTMERRYFKNPPGPSFIGNKELTMMKAIQFVLDGEYAKARGQFEKILRIIEFLRNTKGYKINPDQEISIRTGIDFCDVMLLGFIPTAQRVSNNDICLKINRQVAYMDDGGRVLEYDVKKLADEINAVFYQRLINFSRLNCEHVDLNVLPPE